MYTRSIRRLDCYLSQGLCGRKYLVFWKKNAKKDWWIITDNFGGLYVHQYYVLVLCCIDLNLVVFFARRGKKLWVKLYRTYAMLGALAWQVNHGNKKKPFVFLGKLARGDSRLFLPSVSLRSLFSFLVSFSFYPLISFWHD